MARRPLDSDSGSVGPRASCLTSKGRQDVVQDCEGSQEKSTPILLSVAVVDGATVVDGRERGSDGKRARHGKGLQLTGGRGRKSEKE